MVAHTTVAKAAQNIVENSSSLPIFSEYLFLKIPSCLCFFVESNLLAAVVGTGSEDIILLYKLVAHGRLVIYILNEKDDTDTLVTGDGDKLTKVFNLASKHLIVSNQPIEMQNVPTNKSLSRGVAIYVVSYVARKPP